VGERSLEKATQVLLKMFAISRSLFLHDIHGYRTEAHEGEEHLEEELLVVMARFHGGREQQPGGFPRWREGA
jgi:hypothetical protein